MADSTRHLDWYDKAEKDLKGAQILFRYKGDNSLVAFHCQQAIEKAFKGYILKYSQQLIEGHSLTYLCKQASKFDEKVNSFLKDCAFVNQFYIETRYPADLPTETSGEDAQECIKVAEKVINHIARN
ncbi:MAG: HEPN domain-containing protein [Firmicutes bacterium]|nr:HEPN domain-containing protein [Bacillota bacterium]